VQNIIINGDYLITLDNDSTTSIFKCEIDRPIYAPAPKQLPETNDTTEKAGSPINLPSVGPINTASSGARRKGFKVGWNKRADGDEDTDNEEMEITEKVGDKGNET